MTSTVDKDLSGEEELATVSGENNKASVELHDGSVVQVLKCKVRHSAAVAKVVNTVLLALQVDSLDGVIKIDLDNPQTLLTAYELAFDDVVDAMAALTDKSKDELLDMDMDDGIRVIAEVVEVNKDFFLSRVKKALDGLLPSAADQKAEKS